MDFIASVIVVTIWWIISSVDSWIGGKISQKAHRSLRWVMILPLAILAYITAPIAIPVGVFWPILSFPAFIGVGMLVAPNYHRWIPGSLLLGFIALMAGHQIVSNWHLQKPQKWIAAGGGMILATFTFWGLRRGDREMTDDEKHEALIKALSISSDQSPRNP